MGTLRDSSIRTTSTSGVDLKGGLYVVYEAKVEPNDPDKDSKITGAMRVIRNRLDKERSERGNCC